MASLFSVLGQLGSDYGTAKESIRQDKVKAASDKLQSDYMTAQLGHMKSQEELEQAKAKQVGWDKAMTFIGAGGKKYQYNPVTSEIRDYQMPEGAIEEGSPEYRVQEIEKGLDRKLTDQERVVLLNPAMAQFLKQQEPNFSGHYIGSTRRGPHEDILYDPRHPENVRDMGPNYERPVREPGAEVTLPESRIRALANKWAQEGIKPPAKYQAQVEEYMDDPSHAMKARIKLSNNDQKNVELVKQIEPKIEHAIKQIEDAGLQNSDNYIFGSNSVLARRLQMGRYAAGHTPSSDKRISDIIRSAAALKVMGVAPWTQLGRGRYLYNDITVHLPDPHDTPKQLYEKLQFLKGVIEDARNALPEGAMDFGVQGGPHSTTNADPLNLGLSR